MRTQGHRFTATIYRQGILRCIDVPAPVAAAFADWTYPPVLLRVPGGERATTLMRRGDGGLRAFLHDDLRRAAGVDTGDSVAVEIELDAAPPEPFPDELIAAVEAIEGGPQELELLPPGLRRQMLRFVADAKQVSTRAKRIARCVELLSERAARSR